MIDITHPNITPTLKKPKTKPMIKRKEWKDVKIGDRFVKDGQLFQIDEIGASRKTFCYSLHIFIENPTLTWALLSEAERLHWILEGEEEKWEPLFNEPYWFFNFAHKEVMQTVWTNSDADNNRYDSGCCLPTQESAQAMFEKLKGVVKGENV